MDKTFTYRELQEYNGQGGKPAYIAYKGVVYDATDSDLWLNGRHQNRHTAADDLTNEFAQAPHGEEVFKRLPVVGKLA